MSYLDRLAELARLEGSVEATPMPTGLWSLRLTARCNAPPDAVLGRVREVIGVILRQDPEHWPLEDAWSALLPGWFVAACLPKRTPTEAAAALATWRAARDAGQPRPAGWTVKNFIWWFTPDMRHWWWWEARVTAADTFVLLLASDEVDPPIDALLSLLRAAGVSTIAAE